MKSKCTEIKSRFALYLDDELQGSERVEFEQHLNDCDTCRSLLESDRQFLEIIRQHQPLHQASPALRSRIASLLSLSNSAISGQAHFAGQAQSSPASNNRVTPKLIGLSILSATAAVIALFVVLSIWRGSREQTGSSETGPSEFALMAADTHLRHLRGQLPLEIVSTTPKHISDWFENKLSFSVALPNYQESSGQEKLYQLEGARLVGYKRDYAAYVSYQMRQRPISLVITSELVAKPARGQEIQAKGLTFHYDTINGLKVLTWSDRGLTYALVSDLEERGQQSCIVCHEGTKDKDLIESLKPKS